MNEYLLSITILLSLIIIGRCVRYCIDNHNKPPECEHKYETIDSGIRRTVYKNGKIREDSYYDQQCVHCGKVIRVEL